MSVIDENIHPANPDHQFDLLVDGELSEADRRELLLHFEQEPDGWRRCALAFLEAQCWKAELGQIVPPAALEPTRDKPASPPEPNGRRQSWRQYLATLLTMAASFLLALVVGMGLSGNWSGGSLHSPGSSFVEATVNKIPMANPGVTQPSSGRAVPVGQTADDWEMVPLTSDRSSDGQASTFYVPAQRRDALDQNMLEHIPDTIPPELQEAFERSGHRVVQQREIVPVQMKDGRRLVVPVDHIEIHYVGRPSL
ncbi:MAG: hypothetical protein ABSG53_33430 [Thermoguttaceae bacterium]